MCVLNLKFGYKCSALEIPCVFIDDYFTDCLPVYPLIYIWSLRRLSDGHSVSLQEIGERFHLTEGDVIKAWQHWEKLNIVKISNNSSDKEMEITFLEVKPREIKLCEEKPQQEKTQKEASQLLILPMQQEIQEESPPLLRAQMPKYSPPELECYSNESQDVKRLFKCAEKTFGMLNHSIMSTVFSFHDWLRLPFDVIEYLLEYCAENEHRNLRYVEKCAIDWADNEINCVESALLYVQKFNKNYQTILQHMGQISTYPTKVQRKFMDKWLHEWNMPLDLITLACDKCVLKLNKFEKKYTEGILKKWHEKGISTLEEAHAADEEFSQNSKRTATPKAKPNRFINFNQREIDFDKYEKMERAYLEQKYVEVNA